MIENTLTTTLLSQTPVLPSGGGSFQAGDVTFKVMWVEQVGIPLVESAWTNPRDVEFMQDWGPVEHNPLYILREKDAARHHQVMQQLSGKLVIDPRISHAFQLALPSYLGVPVNLVDYVYHKHLRDSVKFPGHQSPEHRRCRTVHYLSAPLCATDLLTATDIKAGADAILERLKPEVRNLIEGITELHSAEWGLTCMPDRRENPHGDLFHFFVKMYIDIGEAYMVRDKPEITEPERIVVAKDYYKVCQACKNTDTQLFGKWYGAIVSAGEGRSWRKCACGAEWCSDMFCDDPALGATTP